MRDSKETIIFHIGLVFLKKKSTMHEFVKESHFINGFEYVSAFLSAPKQSELTLLDREKCQQVKLHKEREENNA
jgi:hypothetical protein